MYGFGPLHQRRFEIVEQLKYLPIKTGDILYRASNAKGPLGLPFSRIVARLSKSRYSHAAMALVEDEDVYVLEINDRGTLKYRLIDWIDTCYTGELSVYRLKSLTGEIKDNIEVEMRKVLNRDPDYDFTFSDDKKYYCTEVVAVIYNKIGMELIKPERIKDVISKWKYFLLSVGNLIISSISDCKLPLDNKLYYIGNENQGLMSSDKTKLVYHYKLVT
jgi:hypothetical protein